MWDETGVRMCRQLSHCLKRVDQQRKKNESEEIRSDAILDLSFGARRLLRTLVTAFNG